MRLFYSLSHSISHTHTLSLDFLNIRVFHTNTKEVLESGTKAIIYIWNKILLIENSVTRAQFHQHFMYSFYARRSQKRKKILMTWLYFNTFEIYKCQSFTFINVLRFHTKARFWHQNFIWKLYFGFEIFGAKILQRADNVDEIDGRL